MNYNIWIEDDCSDYFDGSLINCKYYFDNNNGIDYWQSCGKYGEENEACIYCILSVYFHIDNKCYYDYEDLDYVLYVEWFDNEDSTEEFKKATELFRDRCIKQWNKFKITK